MAKSPIVFFREDDFPEVKEPWIGKLLPKLNDLARQVTNAMTGRLSITDNMSGFWWDGNIGFYNRTTSSDARGALEQSWHNFSMENGAVADANNRPRYRRDSNGITYITGLLSNAVIGTVFATLPEGYRSQIGQHLPVVTGTSLNLTGVIYTFPNGDIMPTGMTNDRISMSGSFHAFAEPTWKAPILNISNNIQAFPISFPNLIPQSTVGGILVAKAFDITNGTSKRIPIALGPVAWDTIGNTIIISAIGGMVPGRCYSVKLLVLGE